MWEYHDKIKTLLSDKMGFHFFELPKLPDNIDERYAADMVVVIQSRYGRSQP